MYVAIISARFAYKKIKSKNTKSSKNKNLIYYSVRKTIKNNPFTRFITLLYYRKKFI